jgi:sugar/nucleoside kinase (ribokinase family)
MSAHDPQKGETLRAQQEGTRMNTPRRWDLLAFGDPCADVVIAVAEVPRFGEKVLGRSLGTFAGGTTANTACAFARLGGRAAVYGRVGDDAQATLLCQSLHDFSVDTQYLQREPHSACASVITMIPPSGERAIVYMPIAPRELQTLDLAAALQQSRVLYAMPYALDEFIVASSVARNSGALVAIDLEAAVAPDCQAMQERIVHADIAFFNESGFVAGTGAAPTPAALAALLAGGLQAVVVTRGAAGAMAATRHAFAQHPAFAQEVVDTTGAGDTFNAAFLVAMLEGQSLPASLRFACAAASHAVTAVGARSGMPDRAMVDRLVATPQTCAAGESTC